MFFWRSPPGLRRPGADQDRRLPFGDRTRGVPGRSRAEDAGNVRRAHQRERRRRRAASCSSSSTTTVATPTRRARSPSGCSSRTRSTSSSVARRRARPWPQSRSPSRRRRLSFRSPGAVGIIEPAKKWVFKTPHTDRMACEKIFADMRARKLAKLALISGAGGFDKSMRGECLKVAGTYGIEVVADESYGAADTDMTAQLTKIKGTPGVQAVLNAGFGQGPAIVTKNYKQLGLTAQLYQSHGVASKEFIKLAGNAAEGVMPAGGGASGRRAPARQRPAKAGRRRLQARLRVSIQVRRLDLRRPCLRRADACRRRDQAGRRHRQGARCATRSRTRGLRRHRRAWSTCRRADHMGLDLTAFQMLEVTQRQLGAGQVACAYCRPKDAHGRSMGSVPCRRSHGRDRSMRWWRWASRSSSTRAVSSTSRRASS